MQLKGSPIPPLADPASTQGLPPMPILGDSQPESWMSAHSMLKGKKMGTVQLAEGEQLAQEGEKSEPTAGVVCPDGVSRTAAAAL